MTEGNLMARYTDPDVAHLSSGALAHVGYTQQPSGATETVLEVGRYRLRVYPDPILCQEAKPWPAGNPPQALRELIEAMKRVVREHNALGMAAPQVGEPYRVIVVRASPEDELLTLINPRLTRASGFEMAIEGCLSLPGFLLSVGRFVEITVRAENENGEEIVLDAKDTLARVIQHEIDHLNGILLLHYCHYQNIPTPTYSLVTNVPRGR